MVYENPIYTTIRGDFTRIWVVLGDFTFHDLRHCALNNLRLAGNDRYVIKKHLAIKQTELSNGTYLLLKMKWGV